MDLLRDDLVMRGRNISSAELKDNYENFISFFSEREMKAITIHEISHWLRDTFSNGNLFTKKGIEKRKAEEEKIRLEDFLKILNKEAKVDINRINSVKSKILKLDKIIDDELLYGSEHRALTHYEIDAQVHELVFLHKEMSQKEWDGLTFDKMFSYLEGLRAINADFRNDKSKYKTWCHLLFKRLLREGILPKKIEKEFRETASDIRRGKEIREKKSSNRFYDVEI